MELLTNGFLFGIVLAFFVGPAFFALIQTSVQKGFVSGLGMAAGICFSDTIFIAIGYFGVSQALASESARVLLSLSGGTVLFIFGLASIKKPVRKRTATDEDKNVSIWKNMLKGFLLNGVNPGVALFWIGVVSIASVEYNYSGSNAFSFFAAIILTVFLMDIFKAYLANRMRNIFTTRLLRIMNRVVGIALIIFAVRLYFYALSANIIHF